MKIVEKIKAKNTDILNSKPITIAFLGDSVTQGCFECYLTSETTLQTVFDYQNAYSTRLKEILNILYPSVQFNIINSGISGDGTTFGLERLERDIIAYNPDLCVVSFGLNDSCTIPLEKYSENLEKIFTKLNQNGIETVFLTQNAMCTEVSCHLKDKLFRDLAKDFSKIQNDGVLKKFMDEAVRLSTKHGVKVCDLYPVWEKMIENGVAITELLSNKLNHPIRQFHYYMAIKLIETILL